MLLWYKKFNIYLDFDPGRLDLHPDLSRAPGELLNICSCLDYYRIFFFAPAGRIYFIFFRPAGYYFIFSGRIFFIFFRYFGLRGLLGLRRDRSVVLYCLFSGLLFFVPGRLIFIFVPAYCFLSGFRFLPCGSSCAFGVAQSSINHRSSMINHRSSMIDHGSSMIHHGSSMIDHG